VAPADFGMNYTSKVSVSTAPGPDSSLHSFRVKGNAVMVRVFTTNESGAIKITVDGQLLGDHTGIVAKSVKQALAEGVSVHLFLRDVSYIDEHGRTLLSKLAGNGVQLSARGVYCAYVVAEIRRGLPAERRSRCGSYGV